MEVNQQLMFSNKNSNLGFPIRICRYENRVESKDDERKSLLIKNISKSISARELYEMFQECGDIKSLKLEIDPNTGISKGYGYVYYYDEKSAKKALRNLVKIIT